MRNNKYNYYVLFLLISMLLVFVPNVIAQDFDVEVEAAILIEAETGQVLFSKNINKKLPPASITKIMTLLLAMEEIQKGTINLEDEVTISKFSESMGGSQIFLKAGTRVKIEDLLKAVTIASANDASVALAESIAGTYGNFIDWMNEKATKLGMKNTHFANSTGLPEEHGEHYSTVHDIAVMSKELVKYPRVLEWASIWVDYLQLPNREAMLVNTNKLIKLYPGLDGLKTGHTQAAGFCLAATAKRDNTRLISVVMNAETEKKREEQTARLLDYGFNAFTKEKFIAKGDKVHNIEVPDGKKTTTIAEAASDLFVIIKRGSKETVEKKVEIKDGLNAPIKKGEIIGKEIIVQEGNVLAEVDLLASENIEKAGFFTRIWRAFVRMVGNLMKNILG